MKRTLRTVVAIRPIAMLCALLASVACHAQTVTKLTKWQWTPPQMESSQFHNQKPAHPAYSLDTITPKNGTVSKARYCLTYDDFVNNKWQEAGNVRMKVKHGKKRLSSGKQEYKFAAEEKGLDKILHDDALIVEMDSRLFVNQRQLYNYVSHFGNNYTRCFAIGDAIVFVGNLRFGDRPDEITGSYAAGSGSNAGGMQQTPLAPVPVYHVSPAITYVHVNEEYGLHNPNGTYCFTLCSNSIHAIKLNEPLQEILSGKEPTPVPIGKEAEDYLVWLVEMYGNKLKPASAYRTW